MNRGYLPENIGEIVHGHVVNLHQNPVRQFLIDSRKAFGGRDAMFIALKTKKSDGHLFAKDAYEKGIRCFLVQQLLELPTDACQVVVVDTLKAIQSLAKYHRGKFDIPIVGITGSNGKTIVKEWLNQLLSARFRICRSPRSYNSQIGVALSILQLNETHEIGIFEAGISKPGEMESLMEMIRPTNGILTHLGTAHLEHFSSSALLLSEKIKLFQNTKKWIAPQSCIHSNKVTDCTTWGDKDAEVEFLSLVKENQSSVLSLKKEGEVHVFALPFQDDIQVHNAVSAILGASMMGLDWSQIQSETMSLSSIEMRMEQLTGIEQTIIINDAYSFDLASLTLAMQEVFGLFPKRNHVLIFSDFPSGADRSIEDYEWLAKKIQAHPWTKIMGVGTFKEEQKKLFSPEVVFCDNVISATQSLERWHWNQEVILIKGSREMGFERIVERLQESNHLTRLEINLDALRNNLYFYKSKLSPNTRLMVMVKAFGYGTGAKEVAQVLEQNQVDYLGVAYIDEGISLRKAGVSLPIMVMNPESQGIHALLDYHLEPEIYSLKSFYDWTYQKDRFSLKSVLKVHLKLDTGMHRLGFAQGEWKAIQEAISARTDIEVVSIFTHLSSADQPSADDFTQRQLNELSRAKEYFSSYFPSAFYHCANTAAIDRFPSAQLEMVRLGIGLYGVAATMKDQAFLQPVHRWVSHVSQITKVKAGEPVGYGMSDISDKDRDIATIPVGYADGFKRILSNGVGSVLIQNQSCSTVGRICMDMMMVDVTGINVMEGDEVILLGEGKSLPALARECQTIPYEILTSISQRVKRIYIQS